MLPRVIRTLTEADAIDRWMALYVAGKHAGYAAPDPGQHLGRDDTWVEVEVPHDLYASEWNDEEPSLSSSQIGRAAKYAATPGPLPPGMASFKGRRRKKIYVTDGNHRAHAAFLRGSPTARFYMPKCEWELFERSIS